MLVNVIISIYIKTNHSWIIILIKIRLEPCYLVNDIGVDIDSLLIFDKHIDRMDATAYFRIGLANYLEDLFQEMCTFLGELTLRRLY